jgi:hypothetical protein
MAAWGRAMRFYKKIFSPCGCLQPGLEKTPTGTKDSGKDLILDHLDPVGVSKRD